MAIAYPHVAEQNPNMRIERNGDAEPFTPRVERFIREALAGRSLDDPASSETQRPDYACLDGRLIIEIKTLEEDGSSRLDNLMRELQEREDWPIFLGEAPLEAVLKHIKDPEGVRRKVIDRMGRAINTHLKKANKQLRAYKSEHPRPDGVHIAVMVNEDHDLYEPGPVANIIQHQLGRRDDGQSPLSDIDAVFYLSERHATVIDNMLTFPIVCIEAPEIEQAPWKRDVLDDFSARWAAWSGAVAYQSDDPTDVIGHFSKIEKIPEHMPLPDIWRLQYQRNPYMRRLSKAELRNRFDDCMLVNSLSFLNSSPAKPSREATMANRALFTHLTIEMAERSIPVTEFPHSGNRLAKAARRIGYSKAVQRWAKSI